MRLKNGVCLFVCPKKIVCDGLVNCSVLFCVGSNDTIIVKSHFYFNGLMLLKPVNQIVNHFLSNIGLHIAKRSHLARLILLCTPSCACACGGLWTCLFTQLCRRSVVAIVLSPLLSGVQTVPAVRRKTPGQVWVKRHWWHTAEHKNSIICSFLFYNNCGEVIPISYSLYPPSDRSIVRLIERNSPLSRIVVKGS